MKRLFYINDSYRSLLSDDDLFTLRTARGDHNLVPGITGWAQVNGRHELSIPVKVDFDVYYFLRQSFLFDMKILFLTFLRVLRSDGVAH